MYNFLSLLCYFIHIHCKCVCCMLFSFLYIRSWRHSTGVRVCIEITKWCLSPQECYVLIKITSSCGCLCDFFLFFLQFFIQPKQIKVRCTYTVNAFFFPVFKINYMRAVSHSLILHSFRFNMIICYITIIVTHMIQHYIYN